MEFEFSGELYYWRGPSPFHFVNVPEEYSEAIKAVARFVTYGWGVIPVTVRVGETQWKTSLFPRQGLYAIPIRDAVRAAEGLELGDVVAIHLTVGR